MSAQHRTPVAGSAVPVVSRLRARPHTVRLAAEGATAMAVRVQSADLWDALRMEVAPSTPVVDLKVRALAELQGEGERHEDYVLKLNGFEVLDEAGSVAASGARDGSTFLLAHRRRRPVR